MGSRYFLSMTVTVGVGAMTTGAGLRVGSRREVERDGTGWDGMGRDDEIKVV